MQIAVNRLSDILHHCPHFGRLLSLCAAKDFYLVGGAIRNALLGCPIDDLDLISPLDPTATAKLFARQIDGHWFWLDKERLQSRVVVTHHGTCLHYDFAMFRASTLHMDLLDRDFTINALALPLTEELSASLLVDVSSGLADLHERTVRMVGSKSFANDPLRIIKGVRHATALDFDIETETLRGMQVEAASLKHVASERVRQEIWKIFADLKVNNGLRLLYKSGAAKVLFGDDFVSQISCLTEQIEDSRYKWKKLAQDHPVVRKWLAEELEQGLSRETLLLWTLPLASLESHLPVKLAREWRLSRKVITNINAIIGLDQNALSEFAMIARNGRAMTWWAEQQHVEPKLLVLALAILGSSGAECPLEVLHAWVPIVASLKEERMTDLVDGHWLIKDLGLKEGPEMSKAIKLLRSAEISGQVTNQEEGRLFLINNFRNKD